MARVLIYSDRAHADLERLKAFLSAKSPGAARRAIHRIISRLDLLLMFPKAGVQVKGPVRRFVINFGGSAYVVPYAISGDDIVILRIWHALEKRSR